MEQYEIHSKIKEWLKGNEAEIKLPFIPINEYAKILANLGFNTIVNGSFNLMNSGGNDWDQNGWQVDFWWTIRYLPTGKQYVLSGSLMYGNIELGLKEYDDDDQDDEE